MTTETLNGLLTQKPGRDPQQGEIKLFTIEHRKGKSGKPYIKIKNATAEMGGQPYRILSAEKTDFVDQHGNISFSVEVEASSSQPSAFKQTKAVMQGEEYGSSNIPIDDQPTLPPAIIPQSPPHDNMTDTERETLHLKGMTAPRTASEKNYKGPYRTLDGTPSLPCKPAPNKAQPRKQDAASHSPLSKLNTIDEEYMTWTELRTAARESKAHADKLAEALRISTTTLETVYDNDRKNIAARCCIERNKSALAAYEAAQ